MARAIRRFSGRSQGWTASSFALIGPPMMMSQSNAPGTGSAGSLKSRVVVTVMPWASIHGWIDPMPSNGTC